MTQPINTDKYFEYKSPCPVMSQWMRMIDQVARHRDKVLDEICNTHPSAPMCKVYDD